VSGRTALCTATGVPSGTASLGWLLDVLAASPGTYRLVAELIPADGFTRPSGHLNGRAVLTVIVGTPTLVIGTPRISRAERRPSVLYVVVPMTSSGAPVSPTTGRFTLERCVFRMAPDARYGRREGPVQAATGFVRCAASFNNARYRGSTLLGEVHLRIAGKPVVRKFSVRLGAGASLSSPAGAIVERETSKGKQPPSK
jgi:hypothetical protein